MDTIINQTLTLLSANDEWQRRYAKYLEDIWKNHGKYHKDFHKPEGLSLYSTVGERNENVYQLRFRGQTVARIWSKETGVKLLSCVKSQDTYFTDCPLKKEDGDVKWDTPEASDFRRYYKILYGEVKTKSPEHAVENALLKEFRKKDSKTKALRNIQPVLLHGQFFQMPTPLKASGNDISYAKANGGGIDMLARIRTDNGHIRLCVCEIKDENKKSESQRKAMSQALAYATFLAKLVTEQPDWWEFFMGHKEKRERNPSTLDKNIIEVVTIMPLGITDTFENNEIQTPGGIKLRCRSLYYDDVKYKKHVTSTYREEESPFMFSGTFLNDIKQ